MTLLQRGLVCGKYPPIATLSYVWRNEVLVVPGSVWALAGGWWLVVIMNGCLIGLSPAIFIDRGHDHNRCRDSIDISTQNVMSKIMGDPHTFRVQS